MNKNSYIKKFIAKLLIICFAFVSFRTSAQATIFFNNGAQIYTAPNSIIKVNGGFQNDGANTTTPAPLIDHNGTITIANSGTPGTVFLKNNSTMQGNGLYRVEQNWENDATFTANNSTVEMYGNTQQYITSTNGTVTTFNNLTLTGTGTGIANRKKTLSLVNAIVGAQGTLTLNDRELETLTNTMFVLNISTACVTNSTTFGSEGFVSSNIGGSLSRATANASAYIFPTGSSVGTLRYRPVILTPASPVANTYNARLGNNDATVDGFNTSALDNAMCQVNPLFYHQINRAAGTDNANIDVFYNQPADGGWDGLAQWNTPSTALWNGMGTVTNSTGTNYNDVLKVNWADFSNSPYVLSRNKPDVPVFTCKSVCANSSGNIFSINNGSGIYNWTVTGGTIASGQGTGTISVNWGPIPGKVCVNATSAFACSSDSSCCNVNLANSPSADFSYSGSGLQYNFQDLSIGALAWDWGFFGKGDSSNLQNPSYMFTSNGMQTVCLSITNNFGCIDSVCKNFEVQEYFVLPNIFTPNDDGDNDYWYVKNSGMEKFRIEIYNRWGLKIYESESAQIKWDGRTNAGVELNDGTYYFILHAVSVTKKDYSTTGYIQLLKEGTGKTK